MNRKLKKIAFIVEEFSVPSAAQQLVDRFLIDHPRRSELQRVNDCHIALHLSGAAENTEVRRREKDFGLLLSDSLSNALANADACVLVWHGHGTRANSALLTEALEKLPGGTACFVHGVLDNTLEGARKNLQQAAKRRIQMLAGMPYATSFRLPDIDLKLGTPLTNALIVVQGPPFDAELDALQGLLPVLERRRGGETGVRRVRQLRGAEVWAAGEAGEWSKRLLTSALSRSNTPQGDPEKDGRTQDLFSLGLVPKLARDPRAWLLDHHDGLRSAILVLDGVVADVNLAVEMRGGEIFSTQLYRPPLPADHNFSRLAAVVEDFFVSGKAPWPVQRDLLIASLMETMTAHATAAR
ncbi:MAG: hypothetical protein HY043_17950 [Verrucomicrobia bacterium]|nr:hypothetical protein [Verrucomicrobiota bacterium]